MKLKKRNIRKLINKFKKLQSSGKWVEFDMKHWRHDGCGSPACIAGWCYAFRMLEMARGSSAKVSLERLMEYDLRPDRDDIPAPPYDIIAAEWLGIDGKQAEKLFHPNPYGTGTYIDREKMLGKAINTLEELSTTGKVQWR